MKGTFAVRKRKSAQRAKKPKVVKTVAKQKKLGRGALTATLIAQVKESSTRKDLVFTEASKACKKTIGVIPLSERAGYPLKFPKGSVDPKNWVTKGNNGPPKKVIVDFNRAGWLPDDWGQGVKPTEWCWRSGSGGGGTYTVYMSPEGKTFYHKYQCEDWAGKTFTSEDGKNGQIQKAKLQGLQHVQVVRAQIKEQEFNVTQRIGVDSDKQFFKILSVAERRHLAPPSAFHFCVVSARRASSMEGISDIFGVQAQFMEAGVTPTWYVDKASLKDYRALGLKAVVGGKLTAARNKCLKDASRMGKVCVQVSDDISAWEYRHGERAKERSDDLQNAAHAAAQRYIVSPVAAARFILAKMRSAPGPKKPQLGGVYMLGSCARTFSSDEFVRSHFILGDFFVVDRSKVRFDESMTLKEDYDFTCAHIQAHGSVMRCNRLTLNVKHYSNKGGAVDERDKKGKKERMNVAILHKKWPGCFRANPKRKNEVIMKWRVRGATKNADEANDDIEVDGKSRGAKRKR